MEKTQGDLRLFISVSVPQPVRQAICLLQRKISSMAFDEKISWIPPENLHLTLVFLGETPEESQKEISESMRKAVDGEKSFIAGLGPGGSFPSEKKPRILWIGLSDVQPLMRIKTRLDDELRKRAGIAPEKRRFSPHLTVARIKNPSGPLKATGPFFEESRTLGAMEISGIELVESKLLSSGARYRVLETVSFD